MSASEVIEQIKTLPPSEKQAVVEFVRSLPAIIEEASSPVVRYASAKRAKAVSDKIFAENEWLFRKLAE